MPMEEKMLVLEFLREHPDSTAREIGEALKGRLVNDYRGSHSMAVYCLKKAGLIVASDDSRTPTYRVNPDADPEELENPRRVYNRRRGTQSNPHLGVREAEVLEYVRAHRGTVTEDDVVAGMATEKGFSPYYTRRLLSGLIGKGRVIRSEFVSCAVLDVFDPEHIPTKRDLDLADQRRRAEERRRVADARRVEREARSKAYAERVAERNAKKEEEDRRRREELEADSARMSGIIRGDLGSE